MNHSGDGDKRELSRLTPAGRRTRLTDREVRLHHQQAGVATASRSDWPSLLRLWTETRRKIWGRVVDGGLGSDTRRQANEKQPMKNSQTSFKPGFHYPSWRPELTARVDGWPVSLPVNTGRVDGRAFPLTELTGRQLALLLDLGVQSPWTP